MVDFASLEKEVDSLEKMASNIETKGRKLIINARIKTERETERGRPAGHTHYRRGELPKELEELQRDLTRDYQRWYSSAHLITSRYIPEKGPEFEGCYASIMGIIQQKGSANASSNDPSNFVKQFEIQRSILLAVPSVIRTRALIGQ